MTIVLLRTGVVALQVLEEFYENLQSVGVSAATGEGMDEFFQKVQTCRAEYEQQYLPELQRRQQVRITLLYHYASFLIHYRGERGS